MGVQLYVNRKLLFGCGCTTVRNGVGFVSRFQRFLEKLNLEDDDSIQLEQAADWSN